jgi:membrane-associated phospholipid phosphatase
VDPAASAQEDAARVTWITARAVIDLWSRFRRDWTSVARPTRARFAWTLTAGWAAAAVLLVAMVAGLRSIDGKILRGLEIHTLERILRSVPFDYEMAVFLESPGNGVVILAVASTASILLARAGRPIEAIGTLAASLMIAVVVGLGWTIWDRDRPDFLHPGVPGSGLSAFPSGHAAMSVPTYGYLAWLWLRRTPVRAERWCGTLVVALLLGIVVTARMVLGAHWPTDILGGTLLGGFWLAVLIFATRRATGDLPAPELAWPGDRGSRHTTGRRAS